MEKQTRGALARMVVTDLDGTLLDSSSRLSARNRSALERLGERAIARVVATGRSLYSARRVLSADFPIDYLVFSSGAGICAWPSAELLSAQHMTRAEADLAAQCLRRRQLDFMLHLPVPESHRFLVWSSGRDTPDFERRRDRYREFARPCPAVLGADLVASQLLAIEAPGADSQHEQIAAELRGLNVVLATSPLDHVSRWIEIFPERVSKARASAWLCERAGIDAAAVIALGNDYNDCSLLAWAGHAAVVANAPASLRSQYSVVAANDADGFAEAVAHLL